MSEITMYDAQKKKLEGLCEEHDFTYRFCKDQYPITLTIKPLGGMDSQISMLESVEEHGYISPEASMMWIFEDGALTTKVTGGTFTISKTVRTKIESILLKMIAFWQQYFFRDVIEKGTIKDGMMPVIDEAEADTPKETERESEADDGADAEVGTDADLYIKAVAIVRAENTASPSLLQRRLNIGYAAAARLMDELEENGVVGPYAGGNPREVLPFDEPDDPEADDE